MKLKRIVGSLVLAAILFGSSVEQAQAESNRSNKQFGITVGLFSDPSPSLYAAAFRFNLFDWVQFHAGWGGFTTTQTVTQGGIPIEVDITTNAYGFGGRFFVPGWNFSPFVGANYSFWDVSADASATEFAFLGGSIDLGTDLPDVFYITTGFDWQLSGGFNLGFGVHIPLSPEILTSVISVVPHIYLGWFF